MKKFKSHFWYNKRQRNGIIFLTALILIIQFLYFFLDFSSSEKFAPNAETEIIHLRIDSLKEIGNQKATVYPFNPNFLTDFKGYQLGMTTTQIDKLLSYRKTGKFVNSAKEFQEVTKINDSLLSLISPYFKFPEWVIFKDKNKKKSFEDAKKIKTTAISVIKKDINTANEKDFQTIFGVGDKLAKRIISYRNLLQGFTFDEQLFEVFYLEENVAQNILNQFSVKQKPTIKKQNLNKATFKEILNLPYIDYGLTKRIFDYKREVNKIENLEELKKIDSFPLEKFDRIALFLTIE